MEERLALAGATGKVSWHAIVCYLMSMTSNILPPLYLPLVIGVSTPYVISAIPLKPSPWVIGMYPPLLSPDRQRLAGIRLKIIKFLVSLPIW